MTLHCIIVDDEEIARKGVEKYIAGIPYLEIEGSFDAAAPALASMKDKRIDLIFLDIQMPDLTGLEWLRSIPDPPLVIITTAYPDYALEGFLLEVIDYLVKPFSFERFLKACQKARDYLDLKMQVENKERYFFIKSNNRIEKIEMDRILFVEALENYVCIYMSERKYLTLVSLKSIEERLGKGFLRVQKSYVVSLSKIESIEGDELHIASYRIPISRKLKEEVLREILKNKLLKRE